MNDWLKMFMHYFSVLSTDLPDPCRGWVHSVNLDRHRVTYWHTQ